MTKLQQMEAIVANHEFNEAMKVLALMPELPVQEPAPQRKPAESAVFRVISEKDEAFEALCIEYYEVMKEV